ncbi:MAG: Hsp20/alpha crystallin family protein [Acidobacteria bacterium]|nr:Hsp20/alpha crystallin family protein [Acidobacteriota bacterium]
MTKPLNSLSVELSDQLRDRLRRLLVRVDELRSLTPQPGAWIPPIDVFEAEDAILVRVELPSVAASHLRVTLRDSLLKIEGRKEAEAPANEATPDSERPTRFLCLEREYGAFSLTVAIKWQVDIDRINARLTAGVLNVRLPKAAAGGREIVIPITEE